MFLINSMNFNRWSVG